MSYQPPVPVGDGAFRASDADREHVAEALRAAYAEGRLDDAELDVRIDATLHAVTYADLTPITRDLPLGPIPARLVVAPQLRVPASPRPSTGPTSRRAVASAALGIGGWVAPLGPLGWIPAIVLGHQARREINQTGAGGQRMTTVGLVTAYAGMSLLVVGAVLWVLIGLLLVAGGQGGHHGPPFGP